MGLAGAFEAAMQEQYKKKVGGIAGDLQDAMNTNGKRAEEVLFAVGSSIVAFGADFFEEFADLGLDATNFTASLSSLWDKLTGAEGSDINAWIMCLASSSWA